MSASKCTIAILRRYQIEVAREKARGVKSAIPDAARGRFVRKP